ncbi:MAG: hypothetical protein NVS2B4_06760 [Ramlibacter sp.]
MQHRHLNHSQLTLAAIDDVIARGGMDDWLDLREAVTRDASIALKVRQVTLPYADDRLAQRHQFWRLYVG